jgi:hypothetical protein
MIGGMILHCKIFEKLDENGRPSCGVHGTVGVSRIK